MTDDQCLLTKLNKFIRQNTDIVRTDYSMARIYNGCLMESEEATAAIKILKEEKNQLKADYDLSLTSNQNLLEMIEERDADIKRIKNDIAYYSNKLRSFQNQLMLYILSTTEEDRLTIFQRLLSMNIIRHSNFFKEIQCMDPSNSKLSVASNFDDHLWKEFQMES